MKIIERSRNLDRNDGIIGQGLTRLVDNCLQDGLTPLPNTGSEDLNDEIRERFREWSEDENRCHTGGEDNLQAIARLAFRSMIVDGDCGEG